MRLGRRGRIGLTTLVLRGASPPKGATPFELRLSSGASRSTPVTRAPADIGAICYTSGTTGRPKGAIQRHRAIVDRKKDMILTAGYNVYPAEVERVLCMYPAAALAAVCRVPDEAKGELAKAYVMVKAGAAVTGKELVDHCRAHFASYKLPRAVQVVESVPITSSGKILRRLLKDVDDGRREI